ncbi:MAG TPA: DUF1670 domain-containing protein [candidate division Zixibacteria bacterium]|nr:DUF1670 domain-containing protein [candidate division Zixibacteria bacterium]
MIPQPQSQKHYGSAHRRFLQSSIENFFDTEFPRIFGPVIRQKIAEKIVELVNLQLPNRDHLRPGQCVWNAVSVKTRPNSPNCKFVPVILTLVDPSDIEELTKGTPMSTIAQKATARLCREASDQGALLSMRDIGLLVWRPNCQISSIRKKWETENNVTSLPHVGTVQDFGTCLTHKTSIVRKVIYEKKDPRRVADETKHSQRAVDRYVKDFNRVRICHQHSKDMEFITRTTGLSKYLVRQYVQIINDNQK